MNQKIFIVVLTFFTLILSGCTEKAVKKTVNNSSNPGTGLNCSGQAYWTTPGCTGYCQNAPTAAACAPTTTGSTTGTTGLNCAGNLNYQTPGCTGYCLYYPTSPSCPQTGGGTATAPVDCSKNMVASCAKYCQVYPSAYNCLPNGTNCNITPTAAGCPGSSTPLTPQWGVHYPGGVPAGSCTEPVAVPGAIISNPTRKATLTGTGQASGSISYNPISASNYLTTSPMLKSLDQATVFYETDSKLKVRMIVKPQPESANTTTMCYGRVPGTTIPGYTKLKYNVVVYGVSAGKYLTYLATLGPFTTGVNSCSAAIDLSYYQQVSPTGVVLGLEQVQANQNCNWSQYTGFASCNVFKNVRSMDCWSMDFEVAADDTKTFN